MRLILLSILLTSCAHQGVRKQIKEGELSLHSVLDLARSAYLKGCADTKSKTFPECVERARDYEKDVADILTE